MTVTAPTVPNATVFRSTTNERWSAIVVLRGQTHSRYDQFESRDDAYDWALDLIAMDAESSLGAEAAGLP